MLRELTLAIEVIAADVPLLFEARRYSLERCLDARLARPHRSPSGARTADGAGHASGPPIPPPNNASLGGLVAELALHGQCKEITLNPLKSRRDRSLPARRA